MDRVELLLQLTYFVVATTGVFFNIVMQEDLKVSLIFHIFWIGVCSLLILR